MNPFTRNQQGEDEDIVNHIMVAAASVATIIITAWKIRQLDWLSTALWFDQQGFQLLTESTRVYMKTAVITEESYWINFTIWLTTILAMYAAYVAGDWKTVTINEWERLTWLERTEVFNWYKLSLYTIAVFLSVIDSYFDFLFKSNGGSTDVVWAIMISFGFYGLLSEWAFAIGVKFGMRSIAIVAGEVGVWRVLGVDGLARSQGYELAHTPQPVPAAAHIGNDPASQPTRVQPPMSRYNKRRPTPKRRIPTRTA